MCAMHAAFMEPSSQTSSSTTCISVSHLRCQWWTTASPCFNVRDSLFVYYLPLQAPAVGTNGATSTEQVRIAVLGASGYTGEEVVRLLALHPNFSVAALTGESQAGKASA